MLRCPAGTGLLATEELDTGEIALARNQLTRVLQRIDARLGSPA